jgi:hypothetical protein
MQVPTGIKIAVIINSRELRIYENRKAIVLSGTPSAAFANCIFKFAFPLHWI